MDLQPTLQGQTLTLRPMTEADWPAIANAASDPLIWQLHPEPLRYLPEHYRPVFDGGLAGGAAFTIVKTQSGEVIGSSRYYDIDLSARALAIGYTFITRPFWGGTSNRELKTLMINYAFLHVDNIWFHVGAGNFRSQKAVSKLGARFIKSELKTVNGEARESYFYLLTKADWNAKT